MHGMEECRVTYNSPPGADHGLVGDVVRSTNANLVLLRLESICRSRVEESFLSFSLSLSLSSARAVFIPRMAAQTTIALCSVLGWSLLVCTAPLLHNGS